MATAIKNLNARAAQTILVVKGCGSMCSTCRPRPAPPAAAVPGGGASSGSARGRPTHGLFHRQRHLLRLRRSRRERKKCSDGSSAAVAKGSLSQVAATKRSWPAALKTCRRTIRPHARWFIAPLGYAEATRAATPVEKRRRGKTIIEIMRNQGYSAFQGVGGYVDLCQRRLPDRPPHCDLRSEAVDGQEGQRVDEHVRLSRRPGLHAAAVGGPRYRHLLHGLRRPLVIFDNFGPLYNDVPEHD